MRPSRPWEAKVVGRMSAEFECLRMAEFEYLMDYARQNGEVAALRNAADTIEKLRGELNKIAAIIPKSKEELGIVHDVVAYVQQVKELEAQCAAMREALEIAASWMQWWLENEPCECDATGHICGLRDRQKELKQIKEALSSFAGHDILEQLWKLEIQRSIAIRALKKLRDLLPEFGGLDGRVWRIIDDALTVLKGDKQEKKESMKMESETLDKIRCGLLKCGIDHDDVEWIAEVIMQELSGEEIRNNS